LSAIDKRARWDAFAKAVFAHFKTRNLARALWWGYPLEGEADPELKEILARPRRRFIGLPVRTR